MVQGHGTSRLKGADFTRIKALLDSVYMPLSTITTGTYSPTLQGATDNPTVVYTTRIGRYTLIDKICNFRIVVVTSSITKTTLTDAIRITLPFTSKNVSGYSQIVNAVGYNATPVQAANLANIDANQDYLTLQQSTLTSVPANLTYELLTGIGVLTNVITFKINGAYEVN